MNHRDCNLDLCLLPPSSSNPSPLPPTVAFFKETADHDQKQQQKMTIFYNGSINVSDVTELQAREIIMVASREADRIRLGASSSVENVSGSPQPMVRLRPASAPSPICSNNNITNNGLSTMHRSLHRFLQMRKNRIQSASPYAAH